MPEFQIVLLLRHKLAIIAGWKSIRIFDQRRLLLSLCIVIIVRFVQDITWRMYPIIFCYSYLQHGLRSRLILQY